MYIFILVLQICFLLYLAYGVFVKNYVVDQKIWWWCFVEKWYTENGFGKLVLKYCNTGIGKIMCFLLLIKKNLSFQKMLRLLIFQLHLVLHSFTPFIVVYRRKKIWIWNSDGFIMLKGGGMFFWGKDKKKKDSIEINVSNMHSIILMNLSDIKYKNYLQTIWQRSVHWYLLHALVPS